MAAKDNKNDRVIARNRKAKFEYFILETFEAGISLVGSEVKSCRNKAVSLAESYVRPKKGELYVFGMNIAPYKQAGTDGHKDTRPRKILMHKREIKRLVAAVKGKGLTIIPLRFYFNHRGLAKLEIGLARGKKTFDKREAMKKRDSKRDIERRVK